LKQLGISIHNYEGQKKQLPPGGVWKPHKDILRGSIFVYLLPFLEEQVLFNSIDFAKKNVENQNLQGTSTRIGRTAISVLRCPSDGNAAEYNVARALHNYAASRGPTALWLNPNCPCSHEWESLAISPVDDAVDFAGPFTRIGAASKVSQITDGMAQTIFVGEVRPACSEHVRNGWIGSNNGSGYCSTIIPINFDSCTEESEDPCRRPCNWTTEAGFKSSHSGGAYFLFGDGSVRFVEQSIDHSLYQHLGGKSEGGIVGESI
jgi:prepilin-type processing-associated H-X9-DG protein